MPQGTVLAPMLFIIMIADIDSDIRNCKVCSFADDTKIMKLIEKPEDINILKEGVYKLFSWTESGNMIFNNNKFKLLRYGNSLTEKRIYKTTDNIKIKSEDWVRDLGIIMTPEANFKEHHKIKIAKCEKLMGMIWRSFRTRKFNTMFQL